MEDFYVHLRFREIDDRRIGHQMVRVPCWGFDHDYGMTTDLEHDYFFPDSIRKASPPTNGKRKKNIELLSQMRFTPTLKLDETAQASHRLSRFFVSEVFQSFSAPVRHEEFDHPEVLLWESGASGTAT